MRITARHIQPALVGALVCATLVSGWGSVANAQPRPPLGSDARWPAGGEPRQPAGGEPRQPDGEPYRDERYDRAERRSFGSNDQALRLEEALGRYRQIERRGGWDKVPTDLAMGPEYSYDCQRIAKLERRMIAEGYLRRESAPPPPPPVPGQPPPPPRRPEPMGQGGPCKYNRDLTEAVRAFQVDRKVLGYGQVGKLTFVELNRPVEEIVDILERDVERWRRVSLDPSGTYLLVNIPFYELIAYESGREVLRMPVIVGQPTWETPLFSDALEYIILNPDWGIPKKIAELEYLPQARRDPKYLSRQGITSDGGGLRQKPGPNNPLGRIKFVMPNTYDVYLHDTPYKGAFNAAKRALSHGCIRLGRPIDLASYLLRDDPRWDTAEIEAGIASRATQRINLARPMPVHIIYSTSRVSDDGRVELRPDVYGKNKRRESEVERPRAADEGLDAWP